jgi:HEAT repeat protein
MKDTEKKLIQLLGDDAVEKQIAAAIVLGELGFRSSAAVDALAGALESPLPPIQRHALEALAKLGPKRALPRIWPLLDSANAEIRQAAARAVASIGEEVLPILRERLSHASHDERRALDAILAEVGGRSALGTLLSNLDAASPEEAKTIALNVRAALKGADLRTRRSYQAEVERFLARAGKKGASDAAVGTALKILGYLEDAKTLPLLLRYATDERAAPSIRQEAVIALRFALGESRPSAAVLDAIAQAAHADDRMLAQTALHTLGAYLAAAEAPARASSHRTAEAPIVLGKKLESLLTHPDADRARFVLELLSKLHGAEPTRLLVLALVKGDRARAERASEALRGRKEAAAPLAKALLATEDPDRGWLIAQVLKPSAREVPPALAKQVVASAAERVSSGARGWEPYFEVAREVDAASLLAALRAQTAKARKKKDVDRELAVQRLLCRVAGASDDDRYRLAALDLARGRADTHPRIRAGDDALRVLAELEGRGFDLAKALRGDRSLELDTLYYVGFHFAEMGSATGEQILGEVVARAGRTKLGKMARNKLELSRSAS